MWHDMSQRIESQSVTKLDNTTLSLFVRLGFSLAFTAQRKELDGVF